MSINSFTYNDVSSESLGLYVGGQQTFGSPKRDVTKVSIPGRNGDLIRDNGRFLNAPIAYNVVAMSDFKNKAQSVRNRLMSAKGYKRLEDTYHPEHYRMARVADSVDFETGAFNATGKAKIIFDCMPQRFLKSGENSVVIQTATFTANKHIDSASGNVVNNSTRSATEDYIPVNGGAKYSISYTGSGKNVVAFYDANYGYLSNYTLTTWTAAPRAFVVPSTAAFVRFAYDNATPPTDVVIATAISLVFTTGKNINVGVIEDKANRSSTIDAAHVLPETQYTVTGGSGSFGVYYYTEDDVYLSMETGWGATPRTFTTPENAWLVRFSYNSATAPLDAALICDEAFMLHNPTDFDAKPLIRVSGSGTCTVTIGNQIITLTDVSGYIDIDCETMNCYNDNGNCNSKVTLGSAGYPVFPPGDTGITIGGGTTSVEITPRWWEL